MAIRGKLQTTMAPRIFLAHGPGDAAGTLKKWTMGIEDDSIIAKTYSAQIFELANELGAEILVVTDNRNSYTAKDRRISVESHVMGDLGSGWRYWLNMKKHADLTARKAYDFGADAAIVSFHYGLFSLPAFKKYNIPIILDMHNTIWPMGCKPNLIKQFIFKAIAISGRDALAGVIGVSPECGRQLKQLIGEKPTFNHIPQYPVSLKNITIDNTFPSEFRILFAGRIESMKGVFDILDASEILVRMGYRQVKWILAGKGSAEPELRDQIVGRNLDCFIELKGQLTRDNLTVELAKSQATITPTRAGFAEGLAKAPLESLIPGIPSLMSSVVPAAEIVKNAAIVFPPSSPAEIANAVAKMLDSPSLYDSLCAESRGLKHLLFDQKHSYKKAVLGALSECLG